MKRTIRVSEKAYQRIKAMTEDPMYKSRGAVGVVDYLLFNEFTNRGRGCFSKKEQQK